MSVASTTSKLLAQETLIPVPAEPFPIGKGRSTAPPQPSPSHKYEGVIDWAHYTPARRTQQSRVTTLSVGEMYWFMVSPIRREELAADRNAPKLTQEHGPFAHVRRHAKPKETEEGEKVKERDREGRVFEEDGEEYEVTADRKRKLQARRPPARRNCAELRPRPPRRAPLARAGHPVVARLALAVPAARPHLGEGCAAPPPARPPARPPRRRAAPSELRPLGIVRRRHAHHRRGALGVHVRRLLPAARRRRRRRAHDVPAGGGRRHAAVPAAAAPQPVQRGRRPQGEEIWRIPIEDARRWHVAAAAGDRRVRAVGGGGDGGGRRRRRRRRARARGGRWRR